MKCGTTSLYSYLVQHPGVIEPLRKEVHYFDLNHAGARPGTGRISGCAANRD
jgi:hypothetical protein